VQGRRQNVAGSEGPREDLVKRKQTMSFLDSKSRFSDRADDYVRYRPHYPERVLDVFRETMGLRESHVVADV
jgi:hypothetical protein